MDEAEDRAAWERACLEALIREVDDPESQEEILAYGDRRVDGLRLEGSYPDTAIMISFTYVSTGSSGEWSIGLWDPENEWGGNQIPPADVAYIIERDLTWA
jgi:hypothetical protein